MASGYYKLALIGTAFNQPIVNILYYGTPSGMPFPAWSAGDALDLASAWSSTFGANWAAPLPTGFSMTHIQVSYLDNRGAVDPTTTQVVLGVSHAGANAAGVDTQGLVGILAFATAVAPGANLPLKRSYIAFGPLTNGAVDADSKLTPSGLTSLLNVRATAEANLATTFGTVSPVRIGRTEAPEPIRVGTVEDAFWRTNASFRRSRLPRPSG